MSVAKTRQKLVDVARHLFAQNGLEATTMNMIAEASQKGRRTLYTYFKNKEEIYYAVIQTELERLSDRMDEVAAMPPEHDKRGCGEKRKPSRRIFPQHLDGGKGEKTI